MQYYKKLLYSAGAIFLLSGTTFVFAEESAKGIMKKTYAHIGAMDKYAFDAVVVNNDTEEDKTLTTRHKVSVKIDRPEKIRVDTKGDTKNRTVYMNNGLFTMIDHGFGYYGQLNTPKTIDGTLDVLFDKYGIRTPLSTLMYSDMEKRVKFKKGKYFGKVNVAGVECDYVAFRVGDKVVHVWVTAGEQPLVKTYSIIDADSRIDTTLTWNTNPNIPDSDFVFKVPKGVAKISISSAN